MKTETITLPRRFNGPPDSANGGYAAGVIASPLADGRTVEVTLRRPPPLERPLTLLIEDDALECRDGEQVIAQARVADLDVDLDLVPPVSFEDASATAAWSVFADASAHPFPTCFAWGPLRDAGDGLRLFAGRVPDTEHFATTWTPAEVDQRIVWAALDCPSSAPIDLSLHRDTPHVLGRITARVDRLPDVGEALVIMSSPQGFDGRKIHTAVAIYDADEKCCARARATWIRLGGA